MSWLKRLKCLDAKEEETTEEDYVQSIEEEEEFLGFTEEDIKKSTNTATGLRRVIQTLSRFFHSTNETKVKQPKEEESKTERRYPKRNLARVDYREKEIPDDDDYIYCDDCLMEWEGDCPYHGPLTIVEDAEVATEQSKKPGRDYAMSTIPSMLTISRSRIQEAGLGVWTKEALSQGLRFGPYGGVKVSHPCKRGYCWEIKRERKITHYIDAYNPAKSNWMRYVNCARHEEEQNLVAYQYKGEIYYRTTQDIMAGVELLVWYGDDYGKELGIDVPSFHAVISRGQKTTSSNSKSATFLKKENCLTKSNVSLTEPRTSNSLPAGIVPSANLHRVDTVVELDASTASTELSVEKNAMPFVPLPRETGKEESKSEVKSSEVKDIHMIIPCRIVADKNGTERLASISVSNQDETFKVGCTAENALVSSKLSEGVRSLREFRFQRKLDKEIEALEKDKRLVAVQSKESIKPIETTEKRKTKMYCCDECNGEFRTKYILIEHMKIHFPDSPSQCNISDSSVNQYTRDGQRDVPLQSNVLNHKVRNCDENSNLREDIKGDASFLLSRNSITCFSAQNGRHETLEKVGNVHKVLKGKELRPEQSKANVEYNLSNREIHKKHSIVETHTLEPLNCKICEREFPNQQILKSHVISTHLRRGKHLNDSCGEEVFPENAAKGQNASDCSTKLNCGEGDQNRCTSNRPLVTDENHIIHISKQAGGKPHECNICSKSFSYKSDLDRHMLFHTGEKPHKCSNCFKSFSVKSTLRTHMLIHTGEKPHKCGNCSKSFSLKSHLRTHMLIHTGEKPHKCSNCSKSFSQKGQLDLHMFNHTGEKPHKCSTCSKSFSQISHLRRHMLIHTGEKPHKCSNCSKSFSVKSNLRTHMLIHTGEKPHKCSNCSKSFSRKSTLRKHMLIHTR